MNGGCWITLESVNCISVIVDCIWLRCNMTIYGWDWFHGHLLLLLRRKVIIRVNNVRSKVRNNNYDRFWYIIVMWPLRLKVNMRSGLFCVIMILKFVAVSSVISVLIQLWYCLINMILSFHLMALYSRQLCNIFVVVIALLSWIPMIYACIKKEVEDTGTHYSNFLINRYFILYRHIIYFI